MDGTVEVRPEWKDLLVRVRQGETLTLTEGGRPVATRDAELIAAARAEGVPLLTA